MQKAPSICLSMIVKDEAHVIRRCLESVLPFIDTWVILDTGSTDATCKVIQETMAGIPGYLGEADWVDFGTNRTHSLKIAQSRNCDYILVIDADEVLQVQDPLAFATLDKDAYRIEMKSSGGIAWPRVNLMRSSLNWRYKGIIHEYAICEPEADEYRLEGITMWTDSTGARSKDPAGAQRDLAIMLESVKQEPENKRYWFYLAQGYEVAEMIPEALQTYESRVLMGGNEDEVWYAKYRTAQLSALTGNWQYAVLSYLEGYTLQPYRIEPLFWLANGLIDRKEDALAMVFLEQVALTPKPVGAMLVEENVYDYLRWVQYAATCHNLGRDEDAQDIAERLLASGKAPEKYHDVLMRLAGRAAEVEALVEASL